MKIPNFPLIKVTFAFIAGILAGYFFGINNQLYAFGLLIALFFILLLTFYKVSKTFSSPSFFNITVILVSFWIGVTNHFVHQEKFRKSHYLHCDKLFTNPEKATIVVKEKLKSSHYNDRFVVIVTSISGRPCSGKLLLNIKKNTANATIEVGKQLLVKGKIYPHRPPNNPDQFDYGQYLSNKNIYAQMYVTVEAIQTNGIVEESIFSYAAKFRKTVVDNLQKNNFSKEELNIVLALILGQQQDISQEVLQDYQFAGAVHILSVSGLHVGFLLLFINALLSWIPKSTWGNSIRFVILFISLWSFAVVAGLSPSVVRSVTMFTFIAAGMFLRRETNIYHTLLVSMLLILFVAPSFLFDVGFQLSYISLFFILWLQPLLHSLWQPQLKVYRYFWGILTVSFAAQIGALPISIYYFHQFPGLFFVTNLLVLPSLGFIMALGVLVIGMAALGFVPKLPALLLEYCIRILNAMIKWVASYENFIIRDIPMNLALLGALYLVIISAIVWFKKPSYQKLIFTLFAIMTLQLSYLGTRYYNRQQQEWIVLQVKKTSLFLSRNGERVKVYSKESFRNSNQNRMVQSYLTAHFSSVTNTKPFRNVYSFANNKILVIDSMGIAPAYYKPDIVLLVQSPKINLERMIQNYKPRVIIADGSNYKSYVQLWEKSCVKYKIPFHATAEKGFYKISN